MPEQGWYQDAEAVIAALIRIDNEVTNLTHMPVPDTELVADTVGRCRKIEVKLGEWRRGLLAEQPDIPIEGEKYRLVPQRSATRTFSSAPIIKAVADKHPDDDMGGIIRRLVQSKAVSLKWSWTNLRKLFGAEGIDLRITAHEIEDDGDIDGPHVGEVWTTKMVTEGVQD